MRAAKKRKLGIGEQLLFLLAALCLTLPASASLPSVSSAFAEPESLVLEDLADDLASYQAEACAAQIAVLTAPRSRSFELFPPRVRAALEASLPRLEWRVSPKSRVRGFDLAETLQVFGNQWFRPKTAVGVLYVRNRYLDPETGRFISTDPLEYVDAPSLYQYAGNSTTNGSDPFGLYQTDFHFSVVYLMANLALNDQDSAERIAYASQYVDEFSLTTPMPVSFAETHEKHYQKKLRAFHFLDPEFGPTKADNGLANYLLYQAIDSQDELRFGIALHTFADTFSHKGFSAAASVSNRRNPLFKCFLDFLGIAEVGHGQAGTSPDLPFLEHERAASAALEIYDKIWEFGDRKGGARAKLSSEGRAKLRDDLV